MAGSEAAPPIRDAATIILVREAATAPHVLMGQRGKAAVFMPEKYVFPGGAVDAADGAVALQGLGASCVARLEADGGPGADVLATAAIRELWEETGLCLGRAGAWAPAPGWDGFAAKGLRPDASALHYFFRALTPPGNPRRFDARFFLADAGAVAGDLDDFSRAEDELSHLHWVSMREVRKLNLPFITQLVLAELEKHLPRVDAPDAVPFVRNDAMDSRVIWTR
ncbi:MAG: NUDIX domain-containing protein [Silicimonas sp.]|nr:NUDIX domain-containing protein [Silicimonas sp.]